MIRRHLVITTAVLFPAMMAALWASQPHEYADAHLIMRDRWWVLAAIATVVVALARWAGIQVWHSRGLPGSALLVIMPVALVVAGGAITMMEPETDYRVVALTLLGTLFVGIGEETAYRGIILNTLASRITVARAVLYSSLLFGLMHSVNVMKQSVAATGVQVLITAVIGAAFGWVYVESRGNLSLVIALHWLYDGFLLGALATPRGSNPAGGAVILLLLAAAILSVRGARRYRNITWADLLAGTGSVFR